MKKLSLIIVAGAMFAACNQASKTADTAAADSAKLADSLAKVASAMVSDTTKKVADTTAAAPAKMEDKKMEEKKK